MRTPPPDPKEQPDASVVDATHRRPVRVGRSVLTAVDAHVGADTTVEHGGVLVGGVDSATGAVEITSAIPALHAVSQSASLTFTHDTWAHINEVMDRDHPTAKIVGWYHSHPGFSVFLSEYDTFIHRNFFSAPWQVAYVVDPLIGDSGFFGWEADRIVRYREWDVRVTSGRSAAKVEEPAKPRPLPPPTGPRIPPWSLAAVAGAVGLLVGVGAGFIVNNGGSDRAQAKVVARDERYRLTSSWSYSDDCVQVTVAVQPPPPAGQALLQLPIAYVPCPTGVAGGSALAASEVPVTSLDTLSFGMSSPRPPTDAYMAALLSSLHIAVDPPAPPSTVSSPSPAVTDSSTRPPTTTAATSRPSTSAVDPAAPVGSAP